MSFEDKLSGESHTRELRNGELINIYRQPGKDWEITRYEFQHRLESGQIEWTEGLPEEWREETFSSPEEAVDFAQREVDEGKVPGNP